jgi:hypothetical protein
LLLSMLPTPLQQDHKRRGPNSQQQGLPEMAYAAMLPTPKTTDLNSSHGGASVGVNGGFYRENSQRGANLSEVVKLLQTPRTAAARGNCNNNRNKGNLEDVIAEMRGFLPTPTAASDAKGGCTRVNPKRQNDTLAHAMHAATGGQTGKTSQLNPRFVMEMMGFPPNHCDSGFEKIAWELYQKKKSTKSFTRRMASGETKPSRPEGTP